MHLIRTTSALAAAGAETEDPELRTILGGYMAALEEFGDELQADILIVVAGDLLADVEIAYGSQLVADGRFTFIVEQANRHERWFDVIWITSDDGSGLVLLIEDDPDTDPQLISACNHALAAM